MDWIETDQPSLPEGAILAMQQHPLYGQACANLGAKVRHFELRQGGALVGSAQVLIRRWPGFGDFALLSRGPAYAEALPIAQRIQATRSLVQALGKGLRGVMATPDCVGGLDPLTDGPMLPMVSPGHIARLDLRGDLAARRARAHGKWRNRLVRGEAEGLHIQQGPLPEDPGHWLLRAEEHQSRTRRYKRLPRMFTLAWVAQGGPRATRIFAAYQSGRPVAAMLFLLHGDTASYHIGWSGAEGRRRHAHPLLLWRASEWLARRGYRALELGSLDTERTPGLARFKLGSGAQAVRLGATRLEAPGTGLMMRLTRWRLPLGYASSSASQ